MRQLPMDCAICRFDEAKRERWGCDVPTKVPVAEIECVRCKNSVRRAQCELCKGSGIKEFFRCPIALMRETGLDDALRFWRIKREEKILPEAGGVLDQGAKFLRCCEILDRELAEHNEKVREAVGKKNGRGA